jgi:hypothetical protein
VLKLRIAFGTASIAQQIANGFAGEIGMGPPGIDNIIGEASVAGRAGRRGRAQATPLILISPDAPETPPLSGRSFFWVPKIKAR